MKLTPAMYLKEEIGMIHFGLNGKMKDWETVELLKEKAEERMKREIA